MHRLTGLMALLALATGTSCYADDEQPVQTFAWNAFLDDWQVLGPFPKVDGDKTGLDTKYVGDEAGLSGGHVTFYDGKLFTWKTSERPYIDFRGVLGAGGDAGENKVAYAWTQFQSPVDQKALLCVAYDDTFIAWLNGKEVGRGTDNWASSLDQSVTEVSLKKGVNSILLKVGNGATLWDAAVRFRPVGIDEPLLKFQCVPGNSVTKLPEVGVTLLDSGGKTISSHRCSGSREAYPGLPSFYALYTKPPVQKPAAVRFNIRLPGFVDPNRVIPWKEVEKRVVRIQLKADKPVELVVVDKRTKKPIPGAEVWSRNAKTEPLTDESGRVTVPDVSPMVNSVWVAAKGYIARSVRLKWPRSGIQKAELSPGGLSIVGVVKSTTGEPLAGATIDPGGSRGYSPKGVTDADGRFEIFGLPANRTTIYPVIECRGFVTKDRFSQPLQKGTTNVVWELAPGAQIIGQVTHKETGKPIPGIRIVAGEDRFGSNNKNPTATTNENGRFRLLGVDAGSNLVHAFSDNHAPAMSSVQAQLGKETEVNFQITEGKPVTGRITDPDGNPLSGVWLVTDTWNNARMFRREDRTDNDGVFTLAAMPESPAEVHILKQGFISNRQTLMKGGDKVNVTLRPVITHTITVRDAESGEVVPGLQIAKGYLWTGNPNYHWSTSEWETTRNYNKLTGVMKVEIGEPMNGEISYRFRASGFREAIVKLPGEDEPSQEFEVKLKPAETFQGRVVAASSGKPLPDVKLAMVTAEDRFRADYYSSHVTPWNFIANERFTGTLTETDVDGLFRMSVPLAKTTVELVLFRADGSFHHVTDIDHVLKSADLKDGRLELPFPEPGTIEGRLSIAGEPLANEQVHLQWLGHDVRDEGHDRLFGTGGQITTDADGRFSIANLGPGNYQISRVFRADLGGGRSTSAYIDTQKVVLLPGEKLVHNLERPAGFSLSGFTKDPEGNPIGSCQVIITRLGATRRQLGGATSDADGRFVFEHLPAGSYELRADHYPTPAGRTWSGIDYRGSASVTLTESTSDLEVTMRDPRAPAVPTPTGVLQSLQNAALSALQSFAAPAPAVPTTAEAISVAVPESSLVVGQPVPSLKVQTLDGESFDWNHSVVSETLLVFCRLWHPSSKPYIKRAHEWAADHNARLVFVSLDWSLEQARREGQNLPGVVRFAGPGTSQLQGPWALKGTHAAYHVSTDGTLKGRPLN